MCIVGVSKDVIKFDTAHVICQPCSGHSGTSRQTTIPVAVGIKKETNVHFRLLRFSFDSQAGGSAGRA
jgi:hypothetical protein